MPDWCQRQKYEQRTILVVWHAFVGLCHSLSNPSRIVPGKERSIISDYGSLTSTRSPLDNCLLVGWRGLRIRQSEITARVKWPPTLWSWPQAAPGHADKSNFVAEKDFRVNVLFGNIKVPKWTWRRSTLDWLSFNGSWSSWQPLPSRFRMGSNAVTNANEDKQI